MCSKLADFTCTCSRIRNIHNIMHVIYIFIYYINTGKVEFALLLSREAFLIQNYWHPTGSGVILYQQVISDFRKCRGANNFDTWSNSDRLSFANSIQFVRLTKIKCINGFKLQMNHNDIIFHNLFLYMVPIRLTIKTDQRSPCTRSPGRNTGLGLASLESCLWHQTPA